MYNKNRDGPNAIKGYYNKRNVELEDRITEMEVLDEFLAKLGKNHPGIWAFVTNFDMRKCTPGGDNFVITIRVGQQEKHMKTVQRHLEKLLNTYFVSNFNNTDNTIKKRADWYGHIIELGI